MTKQPDQKSGGAKKNAPFLFGKASQHRFLTIFFCFLHLRANLQKNPVLL